MTMFLFTLSFFPSPSQNPLPVSHHHQDINDAEDVKIWSLPTPNVNLKRRAPPPPDFLSSSSPLMHMWLEWHFYRLYSYFTAPLRVGFIFVSFLFTHIYVSSPYTCREVHTQNTPDGRNHLSSSRRESTSFPLTEHEQNRTASLPVLRYVVFHSIFPLLNGCLFLILPSLSFPLCSLSLPPRKSGKKWVQRQIDIQCTIVYTASSSRWCVWEMRITRWWWGRESEEGPTLFYCFPSLQVMFPLTLSHRRRVFYAHDALLYHFLLYYF